MKQNDLTLAICMYNAERYIEETLGCVMEQTIQNFHLLIIDDCSTDGSLDKVERFFANNMRQYESWDCLCTQLCVASCNN